MNKKVKKKKMIETSTFGYGTTESIDLHRFFPLSLSLSSKNNFLLILSDHHHHHHHQTSSMIIISSIIQKSRIFFEGQSLKKKKITKIDGGRI